MPHTRQRKSSPDPTLDDADTGSGRDAPNTRSRGRGRGCGRGRGRGRGGHSTAIEASTLFPGGSLTTTFQVELSHPPASQLPPATSIQDTDTVWESESAVSQSQSTSHPCANRSPLGRSSPAEFIDIAHVSDSSESEDSSPTTSQPRFDTSEAPAGSSVPRAGPHSRSPRRRRTPGSRQGGRKAKDVWSFYDEEDGDAQVCTFCRKIYHNRDRFKVKKFGLNTGTTVLRTHLHDHHLADWVDSCDQAGIPITADFVQEKVEAHRRASGQGNNAGLPQKNSSAIPQSYPYSREAFIDALMKWIVSDDQSLNVIENKFLREIFLMLRSDLKNSDIPHRTQLRERVMQTWEDHIDHLTEHIQTHALGKISSTTDMWSDPNLTPFMAVTIHWMEGTKVSTPDGDQYRVRLRSDLIGFIRVPGHHDGEHLMTAYLHVINRVKIAHRLGWINMDNASNNNRFIRLLALELQARGIDFSADDRRIRCFPHIVNLACKAILAAITDMDYAREPQTPEEHTTFLDAIDHDPIATLRAFVRAVRASPLRRQHFAKLTLHLYEREIQLIRDVDTRWSSTFLMIERALELEEAIKKMIAEFPELKKYTLSDDDWAALETAEEILCVPHAFQQILSQEKTPSLGRAIPAFEGLKHAWTKLKIDIPLAASIIDAGLDKLQQYRELADQVPAYLMAMALDPTQRLSYYENHDRENFQNAKALLLEKLKPYHDFRLQTSRPQPRQPQQPDVPLHPPGAPAIGLGLPSGRRRNARQPRSASQSAADILGLQGLNARANDDKDLHDEENQLRYPTLFLAAMDYLPIPGSAVPCERVFSSAKETMAARRNRITAELMEALQVIKYSIYHGGCILDFSVGMQREQELEYLEIRLNSSDTVSYEL